MKHFLNLKQHSQLPPLKIHIHTHICTDVYFLPIEHCSVLVSEGQGIESEILEPQE